MRTITPGTKIVEEEHWKQNNVQQVHDDKVDISFLAEDVALGRRQMTQEHSETNEVDVVGDENHYPEACDVFRAELESKKTK